MNALQTLKREILDAESRRLLEEEAARTRLWSTVVAIARAGAANIETTADDVKTLHDAMLALEISVDELSQSFDQVAAVVEAELSVIAVQNEECTWRRRENPLIALNRVEQQRRPRPHLFPDATEPRITLDLTWLPDLEARVWRSREVLNAQRVLSEAPYEDVDQRQVASAVAAQARAAIAGADGDAGDLDAAASGYADVHEIGVMTSFMVTLEDCSTREEGLPATWGDGVRPSLAKMRLNEITESRPELQCCDVAGV